MAAVLVHSVVELCLARVQHSKYAVLAGARLYHALLLCEVLWVQLVLMRTAHTQDVLAALVLVGRHTCASARTAAVRVYLLSRYTCMC